MRWWEEWSALTRAQARERAQSWWGSQDAQLAWLDARLNAAGVELHWNDDASVVNVWHWLIAIAAGPQQTPMQPLPNWYNVNSTKYDAEYGPVTAIAGDALAHSLEVYLRAECPRLQRALGPRPRGKSHWEGQNEPVLVLPEYRHGFPVYVGFEEADRFASWAVDSPGEDRLLAVRRDNALELYEVAVRKSQDAVEIEPEFDVERSSDPDYRWELWLDPILAVEAESKVPAFTDALGKLPVVTGVYHQDREQLQVAGKITKKALLDFTREWWATNARD